MELLGDRRAAHHGTALDHFHPQAGAAEIGRAGEAVVAGPDDDNVVGVARAHAVLVSRSGRDEGNARPANGFVRQSRRRIVAKKKGKDKAPKRVAGVKVPKAVRGGLVASFLDDPRTREILADVLMAAAGAAAAALVKHRPSGREVADAGAAAAGATRDVAQDAAALITDTVTEAARHILPRSMTGRGRQRRQGPGQGPGLRPPCRGQPEEQEGQGAVQSQQALEPCAGAVRRPIGRRARRRRARRTRRHAGCVAPAR